MDRCCECKSEIDPEKGYWYCPSCDDIEVFCERCAHSHDFYGMIYTAVPPEVLRRNRRIACVE